MSSHLSEEQIAAWITGERSREVEAHLLVCAACAAEVERTAGALELIRESGVRCAQYWDGRAERTPSRIRLWWVIAAPVMAVLLTAVLIHQTSHRTSAPPPSPAQPARAGFIQIPYVVPPLPYERTEIIHMNVPVAALIAVGFRMDELAGASVPADVWVGQDNRPLAIRFLE